jgi:hypothetical protein
MTESIFLIVKVEWSLIYLLGTRITRVSIREKQFCPEEHELGINLSDVARGKVF